MVYDPITDPQAQKLSDWILLAQQQGLHLTGRGWDGTKGDAIRAWLERGRSDGIIAAVGPPSDRELEQLSYRFQLVRGWLLFLIVVGGVIVVSPIRQSLPPLVLASLAGLLGSAVAALISCLDRRAAGFEARDGTAYPDPSTKKERFGWGMAEWLATRPALGVFMGGLVYLGLKGGILKVSADSLYAITFWSALGGLFAKTLYDMLLGLLKSLVPKP